MPNHCSPSKQPHNNIDTCYDSNDLKAIAKAYNSYIKKKTCVIKTHALYLNLSILIVQMTIYTQNYVKD